jgi:hypothetical protein
MKLQELRELYVSPNGDRWDVGRDSSGRLQVVHRANEASGGSVTLLDIGTFLTMRHNLGPEHQALIHLLRSGSLDSDVPVDLGELSETHEP